MSATLLDPAIPYLRQALDIEQARPVLARQLGELDLHSARLIRHKPGRRCLIEYEATTPAGPWTFIGKVRAKGLDTRTHATLTTCLHAGIPVPDPLGLVPEFQMLLQRKAPGVPLTDLLSGPRGIVLARGAARIARQLHTASIPTDRRHTLVAELRILHERLPLVAQQHPGWAERLNRLLAACDRLAWTVPASFAVTCGIHRDFYSDQVLVDGDDLVLLDVDLFCEGDPALDIGNFAAHIIEQSMREHGSPDALDDRRQALVEGYLALAGEQHREAVDAYTTLSLVRHIWISTRMPERSHITGILFDLSEERLACLRVGTQSKGAAWQRVG